MEKWCVEFDYFLWRCMGEEVVKNGGYGGMDFIMLWCMIYCLCNNELFD